jgi:hypothetical protein
MDRLALTVREVRCAKGRLFEGLFQGGSERGLGGDANIYGDWCATSKVPIALEPCRGFRKVSGRLDDKPP